MLDITEAERAYFVEMRCLTTDSQGREVLVGLTAEETALYLAHARKSLAGDHDPEGDAIFVALYDKHEKSRLEVLGAEHYVRTENPIRH